MTEAFFDPAFLPNDVRRYDVFSSFRREHPCVRGAQPFPGAGEAFYVFSHAHISEVLRHPRLLQAPPGAYQELRSQMMADPVFAFFAQSMLLSDPPRHRELRHPLAKVFTPSAILALEERLRDKARSLGATCVANGRFDVVHDFAIPFVVHALELVLGFSIDDPAWLKKMTAEIAVALDFRSEGASARYTEACGELARFVESGIAEGAVHDKGIASLMLELRDKGSWTHEETVANLMFLLFAGQETTIDAIGNAALALHRNPEERQRLRSGQVSASQAAEELLRYDAPLHFAFARIAASEVVIARTIIPAGAPVIAVLASGNHDEAIFPDGHRLRLDRTGELMSTFGSGLHVCLGQHLARLEMSIAIETLFKQMPEWRLHEGQTAHRRTIIFQGLTAAPASFIDNP